MNARPKELSAQKQKSMIRLTRTEKIAFHFKWIYLSLTTNLQLLAKQIC